MTTLWDDSIVRQKFIEAAEIVLQVANGDLHRDNIRTEPFTERIQLAASARATS